MIEQKERTAIIKTIRRVVSNRLFHPWWSITQIENKAATIEALAPDLQNSSEDDFNQKVNAWLTEFGLSHMVFFHVSGRQSSAAVRYRSTTTSFCEWERDTHGISNT